MKTTLFIGMYLALQTVCTMIPSDLSLLEPCISPDLCKSEGARLKNICESGSCQIQDSEGCNVTIQAVFSHSPLCRKVCVCAEEDPCIILQMLTSLCLAHLEGDGTLGIPDESSVATQQEISQAVHENMKLKAEWKLSRLSGYVAGPNASCLQEMILCIQDEVCNRQLVPFVQSCSGPQCDPTQCKLATRRFYSGLPHNIAEMLVFCHCVKGEKDCEQVWATLQTTSCSEAQVPPWSCLEMLDSCTRDALCRQIFEAFLYKCFGPEDTSYSEHSTMDLHVIDLNYFLSEDKECRKAFVATMGSILQSPCTCQELYDHDLYKCNMLQQAIQNRSRFRLHRANRNVSLQSQVNKSNTGHSQFNDRLWYFLVYVFVVVILIVVAIILHKLGRMHTLSKKARFNPPQGSTKSFVL